MVRVVPKPEGLGRRRLDHCRNCPNPITGRGRLTYCSEACRQDFHIKYFPSSTRFYLSKRDGGICALCGRDAEKLRRILRYLPFEVRMVVAKELGFSRSTHSGHFWQADHIHACINGGWGKGLDNFRTLCSPCHRMETAKLARQTAIRRKVVKALDMRKLVT